MRRDPERLNRHGTYTCYTAGCGCAECKEAARLYRITRWRRLGRPERAKYDAARHRHPSLNCYKKHGCRCPSCCAINTADVRYYAERRRNRVWA